MAKNVSREFATMDDDERRRFALEQLERDAGEVRPDEVRPVEFPDDDPRNPPPDEQKSGGGRK
jgi:hypothetical protein